MSTISITVSTVEELNRQQTELRNSNYKVSVARSAEGWVITAEAKRGTVSYRPPTAEKADGPADRVTGHHLTSYGLDEEMISDKLALLSTHSRKAFETEVTVEDFDSSKRRTRRFDLVRWFPHRTFKKIVHLYELKRDIIDYEDVVMTVEAKRYRLLAERHYNSKCVLIYLVAPHGGTAEAHEKAKEVGAEILTVEELANQLLDEAAAKHKNDEFFIEKLKHKFSKILSRA